MFVSDHGFAIKYSLNQNVHLSSAGCFGGRGRGQMLQCTFICTSLLRILIHLKMSVWRRAYFKIHLHNCMIWNVKTNVWSWASRGHNWLHIQVCKSENVHMDGFLTPWFKVRYKTNVEIREFIVQSLVFGDKYKL